jgi:membrane protease YdiL (CAAX protease family)
MKKLHDLVSRGPVLSTTLIITFSIGILMLFKYATDVPEDRELYKTIARYSISVLLITILVKLNWHHRAGISNGLGTWHKRWGLASTPMMLIGLLNLVGIDWSTLHFSFGNTSMWVIQNFSTGLFEEVLLRGIAFYILARAWADEPGGLMKAAITQGLIFGVLHFVNIPDAGFVMTSIQVTYATLLGFGFAGLVVFTRSIWPGVFIHTFINMMGSTQDLMKNPPAQIDSGPEGYVVAILLIGLLSGLPGVLFIRYAQKGALASRLDFQD